jgi:transcriptional regulator NrdR family protein
LDHIAYVRFTIVYLKLDNLSAIKAEIEKSINDQN